MQVSVANFEIFALTDRLLPRIFWGAVGAMQEVGQDTAVGEVQQMEQNTARASTQT